MALGGSLTRPMLLLLLISLLLAGVQKSSTTDAEDYLDRCCDQGERWAGQKLRCERFSGEVLGVPREEQAACQEAFDICCRRTFQEADCELGKADAKAGRVCRTMLLDDGDTDAAGKSTSVLGIGNFKHECCEACKLGILTGSSGKGCAPRKFSLGAPRDPAFRECCDEAKSSNTTNIASTSTMTLLSTETEEELDFDNDEHFSTNTVSDTRYDDLCKLLKGLLCSEICVPTPGSFYCKCQEGSILQVDGRTCKSNVTTTAQSPTISSTTPSTTKSKPTTTIVTTKSEPITSSTKSPTTAKYRKKAVAWKKKEKAFSPASTLKQLLQGAKLRTTRSSPSTEDNELSSPCPSGYRFAAANGSCEDVNECKEKLVPVCPPTSSCLHTNGSYHCVKNASGSSTACELGYRWNFTFRRCDDVDECLENTHKCLTDSEICRNLEGSYECQIKCERGFIFNGHYGACIDVNECTELTNVCPQVDALCINTLGSYECRSISEYHQLYDAGEANFGGPGANSNAALDENQQQRPDYDSATVDEPDIDECQLHPQPCAPGEICRNIIGGYDCIPAGCPRGFVLAGEFCQDMNECELNLHSCASHERCQNTNGSFTCEPPRTTKRPSTTEPLAVLCRKGFKPDNETRNCVDIDECMEGPGCRDHERCRNLIGSYDCLPLCGPGWYFHIQTKTCQDVDECLLGHHNCRQRTQFCRNTNGSFVCEPLSACGPGYRRAQDGSCQDIDECLEKLHTCSRESHRYCVNRDGDYECITRLPSCSRGFEYSLLTRECEDVDECRSGKARCESGRERCVNLPGGYRCERFRPPDQLRGGSKKRPACPSGYSYDPALRRCSDIDECAENSHNCGNEKCYNLPGRFHCAKALVPVIRKKITTATTTTTSEAIKILDDGNKCDPGFKFNAFRHECIDINECTELEDACSSNEDCLNNPGSFTCTCRVGFRRESLTGACVDINECQLKNHCLASQRCDNTIGSYVCVRFLSCGTGYTLNAATEICEDDDECLLGTHDCARGYHCRNTLGSFRCDKDQIRPTPAVSRFKTPRPTLKTTLLAYTTARSVSTAAPVTSPKPEITNPLKISTTIKPNVTSTSKPMTTVKSVVDNTSKPKVATTSKPKIMTTIKPKFTLKPMPHIPATTKSPNLTITTTEEIPTVGTVPGITQKPKTSPITTLRPRTCPRGFETGPLGQCIDIDECHRNLKMCGNQRCVNTLGSFRCEPKTLCSIGYAPDRLSGICKDIDECAQGTHKCGPNQTCENRPGGYVCYCPPGYEVGGGHECVDIDECSRVAGLCGSGGHCVNTPGSYSCACEPGFENELGSLGCRDVDECRSQPAVCQQECYNTWGGHRCGCRFGYRLRPDNRTCEDVDECTEFRENNLCIGICENTPGSYSCSCPDGYKLAEDARTCIDIDECVTGNVCKTAGDLCMNLRGGFRCNRIVCPAGYIRDPNKMNRCIRENPYCPVHDQACFQRPAHYTYNYIGMVSMYPIPATTGQVELFTMRGTYTLPGSSVRFSMALIGARAPPRIQPATESCFALRQPFASQAVLVMTKSLQGPQDIELEFSMEIYGPTGTLAGSAIAKIFIIVTQYEF